MNMSVSSKLSLSLGEQQLAKLTNECLEIRMRALDQVETRFMRCREHNETINFKPVLLLKQLIRWFGYTPPTSSDRVLALMLELLRSDYADAIVRKISRQRLLTELDKIHKILQCLQSKRALELLTELQKLINAIYKEDETTSTASSEIASTVESQRSYNEPDLFTIENFELGPDDFESNWSNASLDDIATMKTLMDSLTVESEELIKENFINLNIKLCDYPVEYFLQKPYIVLQLLHAQQLHVGESLKLINDSLATIVRMMQQRLIMRRKVQGYKVSVEAQEMLPKQLRVSSAMTLIMNGCLEVLYPPLVEYCSDNWHVINLMVEVIRTLVLVKESLTENVMQKLGIIVTRLIHFCCNYNDSNSTVGTNLRKVLMIPRLESLIFSGLLMDVGMLAVSRGACINKTTARTLLNPLIRDIIYLTCQPDRLEQLNNLCSFLFGEIPTKNSQLTRLQDAYTLALNQLTGNCKLSHEELLKSHREICLVIEQLGSCTLLKILIQAIIKCTSFYTTQPMLRVEAESLLFTLFAINDNRLQSYVFHMLKQPVVAHFHGFMNNSNYFTGCSNIDLARKQVLGLPMSTELLRHLIGLCWLPKQSQVMQQWCVDYLIMLLGLLKLIDTFDYYDIFQMILPVVSLIVCLSVKYPQLHQLLWELFDPDSKYLTPPQALRGNVCYMFHPNDKVRKDAIARVAYVLIWQDNMRKYKPDMNKLSLDCIGSDICVVTPPIVYGSIFNERDNSSFMRSLHALLQLLQTPDLKSSIRTSTFKQLSVLLHSWHAVDAFTSCDGTYGLCLKTLHNPLLRTQPDGNDDVEILRSAISILMRVFFRSEHFRAEFKDNAEIMVCLLRCLFLLSRDEQMRVEISVCIFQLLFHDHITTTADTLTLNVDLSALHVPVSYRLERSMPASYTTKGLELQKEVYTNYFDSNSEVASQYWRFYMANIICGAPDKIKLSTIHELDMVLACKLNQVDLALVQATLIKTQMQKQLYEAHNCTSHDSLLHLVGSLEMFLVFLSHAVPSTWAKSLWMLMHKYLRLMPGNNADLQLYMALISLCHNCLLFSLPDVQEGLSKALETDPHHSFLVVLRDRQISLNILHAVAQCLVQLICKQRDPKYMAWHQKMFMELSTIARTHFELRNLQHVRCLLSVLRQLSGIQLKLDNTQLQTYYQHFVQLSSNLRTYTQTGAQWQRDCLLIVCHLQARMKLQRPPNAKPECGNQVLRYFLGLCGHTDGEVRTLSWVSIGSWIKSNTGNVLKVLQEFINFLPGGLAACCLSTMLDNHEQLIIRELAGRVFELLMPHIGAAAVNDYFMYHKFLQQAHTALGVLHVEPLLSLDDKHSGSYSNCEIITCYVSICARMVVMHPVWCEMLCEHAFVNALGDVLKVPTPSPLFSGPYLELCAGQICKLFALFYVHNNEFLARSICRDPVLLESFLALIEQVLAQKVVPENQVMQLLKMLMVFCKYKHSFDFLTERFKLTPKPLVDILHFGLHTNLMHHAVQRYTLSMLSLLLIRAQASHANHWLVVLEGYLHEKPSNGVENEESDKHKENNANALNKQLQTMSLKPKKNDKKSPRRYRRPDDFEHAALVVFYNLADLFDLYYPVKTYSFLQPPTRQHALLCEVLGNLVKLSPSVTKESIELNLIDRVLKLVETFLDDPNVGNATVYVRRMGAHRSRDIINNLLLLLNMLMHWYNTPLAVITNQLLAARVVRMLIRLWPWLSHSGILKYITVRLVTLFTEHSFEVCKQASVVLPSQTHSLLQLMVRVADHETTKKETGKGKTTYTKDESDSIVVAALHVMINCCSCAEGRLSLAKMRVLDMFDTILPISNCISARVKPDTVLGWLSFWEIFSRYELGDKVCHLDALVNCVRCSTPLCAMRLHCLRILRNMCFCSSNRSQLVGSDDFVNMLRSVVTRSVRYEIGDGDAKPDSYMEHHLVVLCLWKLFGFSAKCKAMLRGTKLHKDLIILNDRLTTFNSERPEQYEKFPFAVNLKGLLANLFEALQP